SKSTLRFRTYGFPCGSDPGLGGDRYQFIRLLEESFDTLRRNYTALDDKFHPESTLIGLFENHPRAWRQTPFATWAGKRPGSSRQPKSRIEPNGWQCTSLGSSSVVPLRGS